MNTIIKLHNNVYSHVYSNHGCIESIVPKEYEKNDITPCFLLNINSFDYIKRVSFEKKYGQSLIHLHNGTEIVVNESIEEIEELINKNYDN